MTKDLINGLLEAGGAIVTLLSVRQLLRDRELRGAHWGPTIFFTLWGCYNLFFYPSLRLPFSTAGAVLMVGVNTVYLGLMLRFSFPRHRYSVAWRPGGLNVKREFGQEGRLLVVARGWPVDH